MMDSGNRTNISRYVGILVALGAAGALAGCGGVTTFQGAQPIQIAGTPLPPPPPPPPKPPPRVEVKKHQIVIHEKVQFDFNRATIKPVSDSLLNEVASVIQKHPEIKKIEVQGHASSEGNPAYNMKLSQRRANSVMKYLVKKGVSKDRLTAKGYGDTEPIADNSTEAGREKNRRVQFMILSRAKQAEASK